MNFIGGLALIAIAAAMVFVAIPKNGESARFLKGPWIIGQAYLMIAMTTAVAGFATLIVNWP